MVVVFNALGTIQSRLCRLCKLELDIADMIR
jgi:hypothetical protein